LANVSIVSLLLMSWLGQPFAAMNTTANNATNTPLDTVIQLCNTMQLMLLFAPVLVLFGLLIHYVIMLKGSLDRHC
jgi:hypothetical protein